MLRTAPTGPRGTKGTTQPPAVRRLDIQGLRAIAVLAVVIYHAEPRVLPGGYVGVDVFFVISGFLITGMLWREQQSTGHISLSRFYARRFRRLLPAAALVLAVSMMAAALLLPPLRVGEAAKDALAAALYSANYRFAYVGTDYLGGTGEPSLFQHYWSLGVEEQFYLVIPLLLVVAALAAGPRRLSRGAAAAVLAVIGAGSLLLELHLTTTNQPWAFYGLPTRAWELAAGALLALAAPVVRLPRTLAPRLGWVGLIAILAGALFFGSKTHWPGTAVLLPVLGAVAVIAAGTSDSESSAVRLLATRPLPAIGDVSYSWYLWHWPVLVLGATLWHGPRVVLVAVGAVLAVLTFRFVEDPVRHLPSLARSAPRTLALGAALTASVVAAAGLTVVTDSASGTAPAATAPSLTGVTSGQRGLPVSAQNDPVEQAVRAAVAQGVDVRAVPRNLTPSLARAHAAKAQPFLDGCDLSFGASSSPACVYGAPTGRTRVVTFGDSHAAQWFPALDAVAQQRQWRLENLTKATCPPMNIRIWSPVLGREVRECEQWRAAALNRIEAEHPALVLVDVARHYGSEYGFQVGDQQWVTGLGDLVRTLRQHGSRVLVLGATPKPPGDVPECLSAHVSNVPACTGSTATEVDGATAARERSAVQQAGGTYLDVAPWVCTSTRCAVVLGNLLVFRDDNHVTPDFARWLTPVFVSALLRMR